MDLSLKEEEHENEPAETETVFEELQCDICAAFPIRGPAFKCMVCENFDLCQNCEASYHHFHPTLQMTKPSHYPTSIRISFPYKARKYMKNQLKQEKEILKEQR
jgi:hypothetical protein